MTNEAQNVPVYVILGATGGIGSELCRRLVKEGSRIVIGACQKEKIESLTDELNAHVIPLDATQIDQVEHCAKKAVERNF